MRSTVGLCILERCPVFELDFELSNSISIWYPFPVLSRVKSSHISKLVGDYIRSSCVKVTVVGTLSYLPTECRAAVKPCFSWSLKSPLPPTADSCRDRGRRRELTVAASPNSHPESHISNVVHAPTIVQRCAKLFEI